MANGRNTTSGKGGKNRTDRPVSTVPFVEEGGKVHGTEGSATRGRAAYAASSVIERGTALKVVAEQGLDEKHECACGCGQQPSQLTSLFMPGHDSKVRSMGKAVNEGSIKLSSLPKIAQQYLIDGGMVEA
jgi:hypothetical protein